MDPLTLKVLATLVQLHGANATVVSDNKGIDELLGPVRGELESGTPPIRFAAYNKGGYGKAHHEVFYHRIYNKWVAGPSAQPTQPTAPTTRRRR